MNILICGDSYAADWSKKYSVTGWPNMLAQTYNVTNVAQAGCCIFKIYNQIANQNLENFDAIIINHTSPNRIYVRDHPVHSNDTLHKDSSLIYTDLVEHSKNFPELESIVNFYEKYFDLDYAKFIYNLIEEKIDQITANHKKVLHTSHIKRKDLYKFNNFYNFSVLNKKKFAGLANHYNLKGNSHIYKIINEWLTVDHN